MQASVTYFKPKLLQMLRNLAQNVVYTVTADAAASALSCGLSCISALAVLQCNSSVGSMQT